MARAESSRRSDEHIETESSAAANRHTDVLMVSSSTTCVHGTDELLRCVFYPFADWTYSAVEEGRLDQLLRNGIVDGCGADGRIDRMHIRRCKRQIVVPYNGEHSSSHEAADTMLIAV